MKESDLDVGSVINNTVRREIGDKIAADVILAKVNRCKVEFQKQDDFTVAVLVAEDGKVVTGVSKRNPDDHFNSIRGRALALSRAVKNFLGPIV